MSMKLIDKQWKRIIWQTKVLAWNTDYKISQGISRSPLPYSSLSPFRIEIFTTLLHVMKEVNFTWWGTDCSQSFIASRRSILCFKKRVEFCFRVCLHYFETIDALFINLASKYQRHSFTVVQIIFIVASLVARQCKSSTVSNRCLRNSSHNLIPSHFCYSQVTQLFQYGRWSLSERIISHEQSHP